MCHLMSPTFLMMSMTFAWAWEKMYASVLDDHAPMKLRKYKKTSGQSKFSTPEIRKTMLKRDALKRKYYKTRSAVDWEAYRSYRNRVVSMRRKSVKEHFDHLCSSRAGKPRELWKSLRPLMHTRKSKPKDFITLKEKQSVITDQNQVSEVLHEYFTNITKGLVSHKHCPFRDQSHVSRIPLLNGVADGNTFGFKLTNHYVVRAVLENTQPNKAQGYDYIPLRAVKESSQAIAQPLSDLINTVTTKAEVPDPWKHGQITRHHKKESALDKTRFRPVTVLPAFAKIFERIVHMQMTEHFEPIFHNFMSAYRKYHGCPTALLTLTEHWKKELDKHKVIGAVAMDLSKAFD